MQGIASPGNEVLSQMLKTGREAREATVQGVEASTHICSCGKFNYMFSTGKPEEGSIYAKLTTLLSSLLSLLSLDEVACHLLSAPAPHSVRFSAVVGVSRVKKTVVVALSFVHYGP